MAVSIDMAFTHADTAVLGSGGHFYEHAVGTAPDNWAADFLDYFAALNTPGDDRFPQVDRRYTPIRTAGSQYLTYRADPTLNARNLTTGYWAPPTAPNDATYYGFAQFAGDTSPRSGVTLFPNNVGLPAPLGLDPKGDLSSVGTNDYNEAFAPVEGLINLNNASAGILKLLPLTVGNTGLVGPGTTSAAADDVFEARFMGESRTPGRANGGAAPAMPVRGPFKSAIELLDVDKAPFNTPTAADRAAHGDISGRMRVDSNVLADAETDPDFNFYDAIGDFETQTQDITRLSNLTTARSDSFTVYIVVQAWSLPDTTVTPNKQARMLRQQRTAFTVDRSGIKPFSPQTDAPWTPAQVNAGTDFKDPRVLRVTPVPVQ